jgi:hypothetical protein
MGLKAKAVLAKCVVLFCFFLITFLIRDPPEGAQA